MANDSLSKFANVLYTEALQEKEKVAHKLEEEKNEVIKKKDIELKEKFERELKKCRSQLDYEVKIALSKRENELSKILRQNRKKAACEVFEKATEKLKDFTKTDAYKEYLKKEFAAIADEFLSGETVCTAMDSDFDIIKEISPIKNMKYVSADSSVIGGFTLKNSELGICADCTLKSKLAEQEGLFYNISGLVIE